MKFALILFSKLRQYVSVFISLNDCTVPAFKELISSVDVAKSLHCSSQFYGRKSELLMVFSLLWLWS